MHKKKRYSCRRAHHGSPCCRIACCTARKQHRSSCYLISVRIMLLPAASEALPPPLARAPGNTLQKRSVSSPAPVTMVVPSGATARYNTLQRQRRHIANSELMHVQYMSMKRLITRAGDDGDAIRAHGQVQHPADSSADTLQTISPWIRMYEAQCLIARAGGDGGAIRRHGKVQHPAARQHQASLVMSI